MKDATRPSRVKPLTAEKIKQVVEMTRLEKPPNATHWSVRSMAAAAGISYSSVQRMWHTEEWIITIRVLAAGFLITIAVVSSAAAAPTKKWFLTVNASGARNARQTITTSHGGRECLAHRLDLLWAKGHLPSSAAILA